MSQPLNVRQLLDGLFAKSGPAARDQQPAAATIVIHAQQVIIHAPAAPPGPLPGAAPLP
jgi:hypothetical protein